MAMDREERERRAGSFGSVAEVYERARPGYPEDAVRWLAGSEPCDVVDLGAGTGKLTRSLVALGHRVTAVEPLPEMLAQLRSAVPGATAVTGTAESMPLADGAADVVTVAQAFHWFDHAAALREIARVLRPGGRIALVWNTRDDTEEWVDGVHRHDRRPERLSRRRRRRDDGAHRRERALRAGRAGGVRPRAAAPAGRALVDARPLPERVRECSPTRSGGPCSAHAARFRHERRTACSRCRT